MKDDFKESIRQKLRALSPRALGVTYEGEAAVLIALFQKRARLHFLLTRRSQEVATHKGQISFPGGLRGPKDESLQVTALRETREELGISACHVDVLGQFHEYRAVTNYLVTAFVGFLEGEYVLSPNPREVESLLEAPVDLFRQTKPLHCTRRRFGSTVSVYFYHYQGDEIWGLTAAIIRENGVSTGLR